MDEDVLSDVVPSNIVSRQVRSSLNFRSALVCSMSFCSRVRASTGRVTNLWKRTNSSARRKDSYTADTLLVKVLNRYIIASNAIALSMAILHRLETLTK